MPDDRDPTDGLIKTCTAGSPAALPESATPLSPVTLSGLFDEALGYARRLHAGDVRKGTTTPYLAHLLGVAALVLEDGGDEDQAIAALLHDAVEDHGPDHLDVIRARFGNEVARIVHACSDTDTLDQKLEFWERKRKYVAHLRHADPAVLRVAAADKLYNATTILRDVRRLGDPLFERFTAKKPGTLWYYACLVNVFRAVSSGDLVQDLDRVVTALWDETTPHFPWPTSENDLRAKSPVTETRGRAIQPSR